MVCVCVFIYIYIYIYIFHTIKLLLYTTYIFTVHFLLCKQGYFCVVSTYQATCVSVFIHTRVLQEKAYEEMARIFEGSDRRPTKDDLEQMKYLDRVIKETLRMYPSASSISRLTETDIQIGELRNAVSESK